MPGYHSASSSEDHWPLAALPDLNRQPCSSRLFHEQDWGGLIAAECRPIRRTYLDDRFELFGKESILEYVDVLAGGPAWDSVRDRDRIDLVWVRPDRGLAKRMLKDPKWSVLHQDKVSVLFRRSWAEVARTGPAPDSSRLTFVPARKSDRLGDGVEKASSRSDAWPRASP